MNIIQKVKELNLPDGTFAVVGSGTMEALDIRNTNDIDLVVSPEVYAELKQKKIHIIKGVDHSFRIGNNFDEAALREIKQIFDKWIKSFK